MTCKTDREPYITVVTLPTLVRMSSASSAVSVEIEPSPPRTPPTVVAPGTMIRTLVPRLAISAWTEAVAPCPKLTIATTAPMPMMMPSIVSPARSGLRRRMRRADKVVSQRKDIGLVYLVVWSILSIPSISSVYFVDRIDKTDRTDETDQINGLWPFISSSGRLRSPAAASSGLVLRASQSPGLPGLLPSVPLRRFLWRGSRRCRW